MRSLLFETPPRAVDSSDEPPREEPHSDEPRTTVKPSSTCIPNVNTTAAAAASSWRTGLYPLRRLLFWLLMSVVGFKVLSAGQVVWYGTTAELTVSPTNKGSGVSVASLPPPPSPPTANASGQASAASDQTPWHAAEHRRLQSAAFDCTPVAGYTNECSSSCAASDSTSGLCRYYISKLNVVSCSPWLEVDLRLSQSVNNLVIHNSGGSSFTRSFEIWVANTARGTDDPGTRCAQMTSSSSAPLASPVTVPCAGSGCYLTIKIPRCDYFYLQEVYVYSDAWPPPLPPLPPVPPPLPPLPPVPPAAPPNDHYSALGSSSGIMYPVGVEMATCDYSDVSQRFCEENAEPRGTMGAEGVGRSALISVLSMSTSDALLALLGGYAVARSRSSGLAAYVPAMLAAPLVFGAGAEAAVGTVKSQVKISSTAGGLAASSLDDNDEFGRSIATIADMDGDGVPELAVGAKFDDDGGSNLGAVYILFMNSTGTVKSQQKISQLSGSLDTSKFRGSEYLFGMSLCSIGDFDGDGTGDIAVGATGEGQDTARLGSVYLLFLNSDGTVKSEQRLGKGDGGLSQTFNIWQYESNPSFGRSIALLGDLDADGVSRIGLRQDVRYRCRLLLTSICSTATIPSGSRSGDWCL